MIGRWREARARRRDDQAVMVTALLNHIGPTTTTQIQRYVRGSFADLYLVLIRLEGSGRVESYWADGQYPRQRVYRFYDGPSCRVCHCTDDQACQPGGCYWVPDPTKQGHLCSACQLGGSSE